MDRFEQLIVRHLQAGREADQKAALRVAAALMAAPLPQQCRSWLRSWPSALLNGDFAPAWPRIAALACLAVIGCTVGFFGPATGAFQRTGFIIVAQNSDPGVSGLAFEPEPLTGARP
jgi:hypothetical protein